MDVQEWIISAPKGVAALALEPDGRFHVAMPRTASDDVVPQHCLAIAACAAFLSPEYSEMFNTVVAQMVAESKESNSNVH